MKGRVKFWNDDKGYGFVEPEDGSDDVFAHILQMQGEQEAPTPESLVSFDLTVAADGRRQANDILVLERAPADTRPKAPRPTLNARPQPANPRRRDPLWSAARRSELAEETAKIVLAIAQGDVKDAEDTFLGDHQIKAARLMLKALREDAQS